ncbi:helix-turn-helix transcriptional regulator [Brachybacterium sp. J153]|uniref:helix-turn-helix transcriptional regulator n=1 Tax=Brachybacterium sp. J153 TaxID=3116488 RepID=UPI002E764BBB|nr:MarR family transcriptional regulator [Brachybacterium sp. J153]MEE1617579.1 MarR family transcriptional regulator [Brachybacterium sp. J153]
MTTPQQEPAGPHATRDRLIDAISAHGPITARQLAERFELTSAAVRRHLALLEADGVIEEHEVPVAHRGRGRPSKTFVLSKAAHEKLPGGYDELAVLAVAELARRGGEDAVAQLAARRIADWESALSAEVERREAAGERITRSRRIELLAELLTDRGYATTVRPLHVPLPTAGGRPGEIPRTLVTAQLCHGRCPVLDVAADHPELCEAESELISRIIGAPVQRLATLAQGAHVCTTHIPLTEGRTS